MAYEDRHSGSGGVAVAILLALILGILVLGGGGLAAWQVARDKRQEVLAREAMLVAEKAALQARADMERALERDQLPAEAEVDAGVPVDATQVVIEIDSDGNVLLGNAPVQLDVLLGLLKATTDTSSGQVGVVVRVDNECRFEHVAKVLSICEAAGIQPLRVTSWEE